MDPLDPAPAPEPDPEHYFQDSRQGVLRWVGRGSFSKKRREFCRWSAGSISGGLAVDPRVKLIEESLVGLQNGGWKIHISSGE